MATPSPTTDGRGEHRSDGNEHGRRRFLAAAGGAVAGALSGCLGGRAESSPDQSRGLPPTVHRRSFSRLERDGGYRLRFRWGEGGADRTLAVDVPEERYREARTAARTLGRTFRAALGDDLAEAVARELATALDDAGVDAPVDRLRGALAFVRSMPYVTDADSAGEFEYPRYVAETLVDCEGDCEDYAALLAGVLAAPPFDLDPALVVLPGHAGVGVPPSAVGDDRVATVRAGGRAYVYLETTYDVELGALPVDEHGREVVAVHDGRWRLCDPSAAVGHVRAAVRRGESANPLEYV